MDTCYISSGDLQAVFCQHKWNKWLSCRLKFSLGQISEIIPVVFEYFWISVSVSDDGLIFFFFASFEPIVVSEAFLDWWGCFCVFQEHITSHPTTVWPLTTPRCVWPLVSANTMRIKTSPSSMVPRLSGYQRTRCSTSWLFSHPQTKLSVKVRRLGDNWWHNLQENGSVQ